MQDNREAILQQLVTIASDEYGSDSVARNVLDVTETAGPYIVILDGDETASNTDLGKSRGPISPRRVTMMPQVLIIASQSSANIGSTLNAARSNIIDLVLTDATLAALCAGNDAIRYEGAITDLAAGRKMQGQIALQFRLTYLLLPTF